MYFKQLLDERYGCASYVVASRQSHEAAIVDPSLDVGPYEALLGERDFQLRYVIETHVHADHLSGARQLAAKHGAIEGSVRPLERYAPGLFAHQSASTTPACDSRDNPYA